MSATLNNHINRSLSQELLTGGSFSAVTESNGEASGKLVGASHILPEALHSLSCGTAQIKYLVKDVSECA